MEPAPGDYRPAILMLARHFPPHISGGARRPFLLAKALIELGCPVFVIAPALPDGMPGLAVPHVQPDPPEVSGGPVWPRLRDVAREWLLWPDPDIRWARRAAEAARGAGFRADWVLTTSPPESLHAVAPGLKRALGARWAADFRDEWLARPFRRIRRGRMRNAAERRYAALLLRNADVITGVDDVVAAEMTALASRPAVVLRQFAAPPSPPAVLGGPGPHIVYTGSFHLSDPGCAIGPTLDAFAAAWATRPDLRLHMVGRLTPAERELAEKSPASVAIILYGPRPYTETLAMQAAADAFIVAGAPDATAVPGKVFEYRQVGAPIIAVGDGPWRAAGGYGEGDPTALMLALPLRNAREAPPPAGDFTPRDAAGQLLALMKRGDSNGKG